MGSEVAMAALAVEKHQVWTFEDLQALPEDADWRRYEIVDGALVVSPGVFTQHEFASARLRRLLDRAGLPAFETIGPMAVDLHPSYRIPDLIVVRAELARIKLKLLPPAEVLLVVEVVSPGSRTTDRITKPAEYAAAGIPVYLRVETEPDVTLTVYELDAGASIYTERGTYGPGETAHLDRPFAADIPVDAITP
ncbi:MAG TPA: Uma2 family endonuclease [Jatrophihabitans sp.]|nr:Uma2 family endonuclease [Jatrophihabitans sp.]